VPIYPHGGEVVRGGSVGRVEWISAVPDEMNTKVKIEFSSTGPAGPFDLIAGSLPNNGARQVLWPDGVDSDNCYLKISLQGHDDVVALTPAAFEVRSDQPATVTFEIVPDETPVIVPPGGSFTYTAILTNNTDQSITTDVWIIVNVPGAGVFGPLLKYNNVQLDPSQVLTVPGLTQDIPPKAPPGTYDYVAQWGEYPYSLGNDSFEVTVTGK